MSVSRCKFMLWSVAGLDTVIAVFATFIFSADLGFLKPQLERWVSERIDRSFRIDGPLSIDLGANSTVIAEHIRLHDAAWSARTNMLEIGRVEIKLHLWSLFDGPIRIDLIDLDDAELLLTRTESGENNWVFGSRQPRRDAKASTDPRVLVKQMDIDRVRIAYESPALSDPLDIRVDALKQRERADQFLDFTLDATVSGRRLAVSGKMGTWAAILAGENVVYDFEGELNTLHIQSSGKIDNWLKPSRPELRLTATGPEIGDLMHLLGIDDDGQGDVGFEMSLLASDDGPLVLHANGNIGQTNIEAAGSFSSLQDLDEIDIDALITGANFGHTLALLGLRRDLRGPFSIDIDARRQGSLVVIDRGDMAFGSATFELTGRLPNFPALNAGELILDVSGPDVEEFRSVFELPGSAKGPFSLQSELQVTDSGEEVLSLDVSTSLIELDAHAKLGQPPHYVGSDIEFQLRTSSLAELATALGVADLPDRPLELTGVATVVNGGVEIVDRVLGRLGDNNATLGGLIMFEPGLHGSDVEFELAGPNLNAFAADFGVEVDALVQPYDLGGQVQIDGNEFQLKKVSGNIGRSTISITGTVVAEPGLNGTQVVFNTRGPALEDHIAGIGDLELAPGPYSCSGTVTLKPDRLVLDNIKLTRDRGTATVDLDLGLPISRRVARFHVNAKGGDIRNLAQNIAGFEPEVAEFEIQSVGSLDGSRWTFDSFHLTVGDASMQTTGTFGLGTGGRLSDFEFAGRVPHLANVGTFRGRKFRDQALDWTLHAKTEDGAVEDLDFDATIDGNIVHGSVRLLPGDIPDLLITLQSDTLVVQPLFQTSDKPVDSPPETEDGRLIPDVAMPFSLLRAFNASLDVDVSDLSYGALHVQDLSAVAQLRHGILDVTKLYFRAPSGHLNAQLRVDTTGDAATVSVALVARDFALGTSELNRDLEMTGDYDIDIDTWGADLRTLAGNANGIVFGNIRGGRIEDLGFLSVLYEDTISQILEAINPFLVSEPATELECIVAPLEFSNGQATSKPYSLVATKEMTIASQTLVDLKTEELELQIKTSPRKGVGISAGHVVNPLIKVVGNLASPKIVLDTEGALVKGGAAVATSGLTIFARIVKDRLARSSDPCATAANEAIEALGDRFPNLAHELP